MQVNAQNYRKFPGLKDDNIVPSEHRPYSAVELRTYTYIHFCVY